MKTLTLALFALLFFLNNSSAQWNWVNPLPQGNDLKDLWVFNQNTLICVGAYGTIVKTTDGGKSWSVKNNVNKINADINSIVFANDKIGWAAGGKYILKTTDAGDTWQTQTMVDSIRFVKIFFADSNKGLAIASEGVVFNTTNGGENWKPTYINNKIIFQSGSFIDKEKAIIVGSHNSQSVDDSSYFQIFLTTNSGESWNEIESIKDYSVSDMFFLNKNIGWIFGKDILQTTDGGYSWIPQTLEGLSAISLYFIDENIGWSIVAEEDWKNQFFPSVDYFIEKTINGGKTWQKLKKLNDIYFQKLKFLDSSTAFVVLHNGKILRTTDSGVNWNNLSSSYNDTDFVFTSISFPDSTVGFVVSGKGGIIKSTNGGKNWRVLSNTPTGNITASHFLNETFGIVGTNSGQLYKTSDGGETWKNIDLYSQNLSTCVYSINFLNNNIGYVSGPPYLLKTTDGGLSWEKDERIEYPNQMVCFNDQIFFLTTITGLFYKTTDGGNSWVDISTSVPLNVFKIKFINGLVFIMNFDNTVMVTKNAGESWEKLNLPTSTKINDLYYFNDLSGYAVGDEGTILYTNDGGNSWNLQESPTKNNLNSVFFVNDQHGFIAGTYGVLLSNLNSEYTSVQTLSENRLHGKYTLFQNYPNPFNPFTIISYQIPNEGNVILKVYDVLGKEITTLVNEYKTPGDYSVQFNAGKLTSGLYFYRINCGNYSQIKKMMLVR